MEWYEAGKRRRKPVPKFENLLQAARSKSIELNALKAGLLVREPARLTMNAAIDDYLEYIRKHRSLRTYFPVHVRSHHRRLYVQVVSPTGVSRE